MASWRFKVGLLYFERGSEPRHGGAWWCGEPGIVQTGEEVAGHSEHPGAGLWVLSCGFRSGGDGCDIYNIISTVCMIEAFLCRMVRNSQHLVTDAGHGNRRRWKEAKIDGITNEC